MQYCSFISALEMNGSIQSGMCRNHPHLEVYELVYHVGANVYIRFLGDSKVEFMGV